jgi:hypothetical protein
MTLRYPYQNSHSTLRFRERTKLCLLMLKLIITALCPNSQRIKDGSEQILDSSRQMHTRRDYQGTIAGWMLKR